MLACWLLSVGCMQIWLSHHLLLIFENWHLTYQKVVICLVDSTFGCYLHSKHRQIPLHKRSTVRSHQCHHSALFLAAPAFFDSERNWKPDWKVEFSTSTKSVRMNINVTTWARSAAARVFTCTQKYDWTHFIGSQFNIELPPKSFHS